MDLLHAASGRSTCAEVFEWSAASAGSAECCCVLHLPFLLSPHHTLRLRKINSELGKISTDSAAFLFFFVMQTSWVFLCI